MLRTRAKCEGKFKYYHKNQELLCIRKRQCYVCDKQKSVDEFSSNVTTKGGFSHRCKSCCNDIKRKYARDYARRNRVKHNESAKRAARKRRETKREECLSYQKKHRENYYYPQYKRNANSLVNTAKKNGRLVPEPCFYCKCEKVEAHHTDYSKPLDVMWLCQAHHKAWHRVFIVEDFFDTKIVKGLKEAA